jgi:uncharacterized protein DUF6438
MERRSPVRLQVPVAFVLLLCALTIVGCAGAPKDNEDSAPTPTGPTPLPMVSTPTIDMGRARQAFEAGGELSYEEVIALRQEIVGEYPDSRNFSDDGKYFEEQDKYWKRGSDFASKLEGCKLKQTIGWVAWSRKEYDKEYKDIPDKNRLALYVYNPFYGFGKELSGNPEMYLVHLPDSEVATLKYGQRITFSGDFVNVPGDEINSVQNPNYTLLEDEPAVPPPTDDELKDLRIILDRTVCFGTCPEYTLTIDANGKVTFEGREYTREGTVLGAIDNTKLIELAAEVKKADFFSLEDSYTAQVTDNPTYTLEVQMGGKSKRVVSYATRPRRLELLMNRIDQIVNSKEWIGDEKDP